MHKTLTWLKDVKTHLHLQHQWLTSCAHLQAAIKAPKSPVKRALMLRAPTSQTISDIALLQREKAQLSQQMNQASKLSLPFS